MANINIDTSAAGYQNRLTQYNEIMQFWKPNLIEYFKMTSEQQEAWRAADPFLDRILKVTAAITNLQEQDI
jgi:hypothetical protein